MNIKAAILVQQLMKQDGGFVEPLEVGIQPAASGVAVGFLLDDAGFFGEGEGVVLGRISSYFPSHINSALRAGVEDFSFAFPIRCF